MALPRTSVGQTLADYRGQGTDALFSLVVRDCGNNVFHLTKDEALALQAQLAAAIESYDPRKDSWRD